MNFQKTSFSFDSKCDFFSVLDFTPRTSSSSWPNGRGHSSPVESVSKKNYWCYSTNRLVLLSYIPSVCPIWKGLTLFYYHREANHVLALFLHDISIHFDFWEIFWILWQVIFHLKTIGGTLSIFLGWKNWPSYFSKIPLNS